MTNKTIFLPSSTTLLRHFEILLFLLFTFNIFLHFGRFLYLQINLRLYLLVIFSSKIGLCKQQTRFLFVTIKHHNFLSNTIFLLISSIQPQIHKVAAGPQKWAIYFQTKSLSTIVTFRFELFCQPIFTQIKFMRIFGSNCTSLVTTHDEMWSVAELFWTNPINRQKT